MKNNHIDGWLYVGISVCTAVAAAMSGDEAVKYISTCNLFFIKTYAGVIGAGFLAGKMYRSTTFAKSQDALAVENQVALPRVQSEPSQPPKTN